MTITPGAFTPANLNDPALQAVPPWNPPVTQPTVTPVVVPVQTAPPSQNPAERTFTIEEVERIRQEEKDKLYSRLSTYETQLKALADDKEARDKAEEERIAAVEADRKKAEEEKLDAIQLLTKRQAETDEQLRAAQQEWAEKLAAQEALLAKEREFSELRTYAQQQIAANADNIIPELVDYVTGNSKEEIDAAIANAVARSAQIAQTVQQRLAQVQGVPSVQVPVGAAPTGGPGGYDPLSQQSQNMTVDQVNALSVEEYAKLRPQLGMSGAQTNKGLFG